MASDRRRAAATDYAFGDGDEDGLTLEQRGGRPSMGGCTQWLRTHPKTTAFLVFMVFAIGIGVGVGVGVGTKDGDSSSSAGSSQQTQVPQDPAAASYTVNFSVQGQNGVAPSCSAMQAGNKLAAFTSDVTSSVSQALGITPQQVAVTSVTCGQDMLYSSPNGRRHLLQSGGTVNVAVGFRLVKLEGAPPLPATASAVTEALKQQGNTAALQKATTSAMGLPQDTVSVVSIVAAPLSSGQSGSISQEEASPAPSSGADPAPSSGPDPVPTPDNGLPSPGANAPTPMGYGSNGYGQGPYGGNGYGQGPYGGNGYGQGPYGGPSYGGIGMGGGVTGGGAAEGQGDPWPFDDIANMGNW